MISFKHELVVEICPTPKDMFFMVQYSCT